MFHLKTQHLANVIRKSFPLNIFNILCIYEIGNIFIYTFYFLKEENHQFASSSIFLTIPEAEIEIEISLNFS